MKAEKYYGKGIRNAYSDDSEVRLTFLDGTTIRLADDGQSCCESRYMRTDDDVLSLIGKNLLSIEEKEVPNIDDEYGESHEVCFLEIRADNEIVTFSFHNEHNGYYSGFALEIDEVEQ